ncbi:MAG TPA: SPOR domain-containing protein [Burkholderiales bacterium]|nr:SPOR domain-containing protein [Burkholderiales bacterium]
MAQEKQDVETLKRRGRRRLVGAVALVLAAVIVLPMVFDPEPRGTASSVDVRIPAEDQTPFAPKLPPKKAKEEYVVQVGAFASPQGAIAKLESAKLPYYTEAMQGNLTRVRAGPFATREAAEKALQQLKALGFEPGTVSTKSG